MGEAMVLSILSYVEAGGSSFGLDFDLRRGIPKACRTAGTLKARFCATLYQLEVHQYKQSAIGA